MLRDQSTIKCDTSEETNLKRNLLRYQNVSLLIKYFKKKSK